MELLRQLHPVAGWLLVACNALSAAWSIARSYGRLTLLHRVHVQLLALSQTLVPATGLLGLAALSGHGHRHVDRLHRDVYGPFMVLVLIAAYGFRTGDARRDLRVLGIASLFVAALGVRALQTG